MPLHQSASHPTCIPPTQRGIVIDPGYDFMYFVEVMDRNGNGKIIPDFNQETPYVIVEVNR